MTRILIAILALALLVGSCSRERDGPSDPAAHAEHARAAPRMLENQLPGMATVELPHERRQAIGVRTAVIAKQPLTASIRTVGIVAPDERTVRKVQTKISGWVDRLYVNFTGQYVKAGQPILSIYSPELVATEREYLLALTAGKNANGMSDAEKRLLVESARNRLKLWDLTDTQIKEIERSAEPRRTVDLHSPISGFVTMKPVHQGMYVTPEMELYTVSDLAGVWIWADVYEDEIELVRLGQRARISLPSLPGVTLSSSVSYLSPVMDLATRTAKVRLDADNKAGKLKPGMYARVELESPLGERLTLPEEALIDTGEHKIVFVEIGDSTYEPRQVEVGRRAGGFYELLGGLAEGDRVVTSAQFLLDSESRLRATTGGGSRHGTH